MPERQESYNGQEHYSTDEIAKGLTSVTISRGGALKLLGSVLLGAGSMGLFSGVASAGSVGSATAGIRATKPPWSPEYAHLQQRLKALNLPPVGNESYHIHALLHVYVNGKPVTVPANIGLYPAKGIVSPIHTHDTSGVLHMEASRPYAFTLGDFFVVWGVRFSSTQLGAYTNSAHKRVWVYVNGKPIRYSNSYVMKAHNNIVVAYGKGGSFPKRPSAAALRGY
jgi:hypothetical protein